MLAALLLAGVRNIQPRPNVGFKFHAVLVVNSAHLASLGLARLRPMAADLLGARPLQELAGPGRPRGELDDGPGGRVGRPAGRPGARRSSRPWTAGTSRPPTRPSPGWPAPPGANEVYELFVRYGCRDFRDIGHKAIYVANSWRTLQCIGWQHAEPVLRSLAYALLQHGKGNPADRDEPADRPGRLNLARAARIKEGWYAGKPDAAAAADLLSTLRKGSDDDASQQVVELLNRGIAPQSIWDALFDGAGELLLRKPNIVSLHAVTTTNALHYAYQASGDDLTRRLLMLQNAAFLTLFRERWAAAARRARRGSISSSRPARRKRRRAGGPSRRSSPRPATTRWPRRARRWPTSRPATSPSR